MIRLEDLPAGKLRQAAIAAIARDEYVRARAPESSTPRAARRRPTPPNSEARAPSHTRYRCATCGALHGPYAAAERHADTHGGARIEIDLGGAA